MCNDCLLVFPLPVLFRTNKSVKQHIYIYLLNNNLFVNHRIKITKPERVGKRKEKNADKERKMQRERERERERLTDNKRERQREKKKQARV